MVDGVETKLNGYGIVNTLAISPDNRHLAYVLSRDFKRMVVLDGVEGKPYDYPPPGMPGSGPGVFYHPVFSPDGQHLAYVAYQNNEAFVVSDGLEGRRYPNIQISPVFSPDSRRMVYAGSSQLGVQVVVSTDGKEFAYIHQGTPSGLVFSPDSQRLAYVVKKSYSEQQMTVVVEGSEGRTYSSVHDLVFSPDSRKFAYWAETITVGGNIGAIPTRQNFMVLDGKEVNTRFVSNGATMGLTFTPDSQHLVLFQGNYMVVDGAEQTLAPSVSLSVPPVWSPDGSRLAYATWESGSSGPAIVVDGIKGQEYPQSGFRWLFFSPDGGHLAYVVNEIPGKKYFLVLDGIAGRPYDSIFKLRFDSADRVSYEAARGNSLYLVEETIK